MTLIKILRAIWQVTAMTLGAAGIFAFVAFKTSGSIIIFSDQLLPLCWAWLFFAVIRLLVTLERRP